MNLLIRLLESLLPDPMRNSSTDLIRGYVFIGLVLTGVFNSFGVMVGLVTLLDLGEQTPIGVGLNAACVVGYVGALLVLRKTENYPLAAHIMVGMLAGVQFFAVQITGGYLESPVLQLALQIPVTAFLLLGLRAGITWLLITLALCLASFLAVELGIGYTQLISDQAMVDAMYILLQFVLVLMLGGALVIYEVMNGLLTKRLNEELSRFEHKASHDDLTGVPNRFEFFRRIKSVLGEARERNQKVGVVYIDLDGFKPVNDLMGHHIGDKALQAIAQRLQRVLRLSDTTARLGGDEFALILPGINVPTDIEIIMPKVLAEVRKPIKIDNIDVVVHASCGIAIYPDHSTDHDVLCRYADKAMYLAKERHDTYAVFDDSMRSGQKVD